MRGAMQAYFASFRKKARGDEVTLLLTQFCSCVSLRQQGPPHRGPRTLWMRWVSQEIDGKDGVIPSLCRSRDVL